MQPLSSSPPNNPRQTDPSLKRSVSPKNLLLVLIATIFSVELLIMSFLHVLGMPALIEIVIDSTVLVLLLMPVLLKTVLYPLQAKIKALADAEQLLLDAASKLEQRVQERTAALALSNEALQSEIEQRTRIQEELRQLAGTDTLTGLFNRRAFDELAAHEFKRAERYGEALSLILFDLDYFKRINDSFGHQVGDDVLIEMTRLIRARIRPNDTFARWGGEEFSVLAPETNLEKALHLANELRLLMQAHQFIGVGTITASFGVTQFVPGDDMDSMLHRADTALYQAKERGRNLVVAEPESA